MQKERSQSLPVKRSGGKTRPEKRGHGRGSGEVASLLREDEEEEEAEDAEEALHGLDA
jgi:hypothetical protein